MSYDFVSNGSSGFNLKKSLNLEHMSGIQIEAYQGEMKCKQFNFFLLNMLGILNLPNLLFRACLGNSASEFVFCYAGNRNYVECLSF